MSELLTTNEAASRLKLSASTLHKARLNGGGPPFVKLGYSVRYRPEDLDAWVSEQVRKSTSDTTGEA